MLIQISIEKAQPLTGSAAADGGGPLAFEGWLELLETISRLVETASPQRRRRE